MRKLHTKHLSENYLPTTDICARPAVSTGVELAFIRQERESRDIALVKLDLAKLTSRDQPPVYKGLLPTTPFLSLAYSLSYND
jgi:hypothetical protein